MRATPVATFYGAPYRACLFMARQSLPVGVSNGALGEIMDYGGRELLKCCPIEP